MLTDKAMRERMEKGWRGGLGDGTICGQGSTIQNTARISLWLPQVIEKYGIKSVCDAGAGDLHWADCVEWPCDYKGYDLFPRAKGIKKLDITKKKMQESDAILCRMVLNHLGNGDDYTRVEMALELFKETSTYLFATHFIDGGPTRDVQFMRLDLTKYLGEPLEMCVDGHEENCRLAMWEL